MLSFIRLTASLQPNSRRRPVLYEAVETCTRCSAIGGFAPHPTGGFAPASTATAPIAAHCTIGVCPGRPASTTLYEVESEDYSQELRITFRSPSRTHRATRAAAGATGLLVAVDQTALLAPMVSRALPSQEGHDVGVENVFTSLTTTGVLPHACNRVLQRRHQAETGGKNIETASASPLSPRRTIYSGRTTLHAC